MNKPTKNKLQIVKAIESAARILEAAEGDELAGIEDIPLETDTNTDQPSLARFLDTVVFLETFELAKMAPDSPEWNKGLALAKLTQQAFLLDAAAYLEPLFTLRGFGKYKLKWKSLAKPATTKDRFSQRGTFLRNFIGELALKPQVFRDTFPDARLLQVARRLVDVSAVTTAPEALAILGTIRSVGGMTRLRAWDREAVKESGVVVNEFDETVAAVGEVQDLGKQIADTEVRLQDPSTSTEDEELIAKQNALRQQLSEAVANSPNPAATLTVAAQAAQPKAYRTKVGEKLKMNPVQETAMMRRGKVIIAAGAGSGKCVTGDTLVTSLGGIRRIDSWAEGQMDKLTSVHTNWLGRFSFEDAQWLDMGESPVLELETHSGIRLRATPEHPLLVWDGKPTWKRLDRMVPGDVVLLMPGHSEEALGTKSVHAEEAYLTGMMMGDGWVDSAGGRIGWSRGGEDLPPHFYKLTERFWGKTPKPSFKTGTNSVTHWIYGVDLVKKLEAQGLAFSSARTKSTPAWLMAASRAERIRYLQGLFDTDGSADGSTVELCSASEVLARQVHQMLIGFGVVGLLRPKTVEGYEHTYWRILITGDGARRFEDTIGFRYETSKAHKLSLITEKDSNPNTGVYPHVGALLKQVREEWKANDNWDGRSQSLLMDERWVGVKHYLLEQRAPSRQQLLKLVAGCSSDASTILQGLTAFYPDRVESVTPRGVEKVYDFSVPTTHSFIANSIVSHNTRVLSGKVVYHINEEGAPAESVLATSFTRKSAAELKDRIIKAGGDIDRGVANDGFGTTHSIAAKLIKRFRPDIPQRKGIGGKDGHSQTTLYKLAIAQVMMRPNGVVTSRPDPNESFFSSASIADTMKTLAPEPAAPPPSMTGQGAAGAVSFADAVDQGLAWLSMPGSTETLKTTIPWVQRWVDEGKSAPNWLYLFKRLKSGQLVRENMAKNERDRFMEVMRAARINFVPGVSAAFDSSMPLFAVSSAAPSPVQFSVIQAAGKKSDFSQYKDTPANQWFNQGAEIEAMRRADPKAAADKLKDFTPGNVGRHITQWKGGLITPGQAYAQTGSFEAAAYAAYEWIKANDPIYAGSGDPDDLLINFSKLAISDPSFRDALQRRFKYVMIDEAQDQNPAQHLMFGLITGFYDPATQQPRTDGVMSADTYAMIGDDKQCVAVNTMLTTPDGVCRAGDAKPGDVVTSFRNGKNVGQKIRHVVESNWTWGYKITTESGASLTMSPNHRLWASEPRTTEDQMVVYLMYRKDMGFRVGITNKGKVGQEDYHNSYGGRAFLEKAERLWVLNIVESRDDALLQEQRFSLKYGIPTMVFNGEHREINQDRVDAIFQEFGRNGLKLLEERNLSFNHPHWMSQSYSKHGRSRLVVNLIAHSGSNTQVATEWSGDQWDVKADGLGVVHTKDGRRRLRRWFANYREGLAFAEEVSARLDAAISHKLSTPEGSLREITASGLFPGMQVPVLDGEAFGLESIISVEKVDGKFVDLDVDDASNFYGNDILSHNSIYEFRGAAPTIFIDNSDSMGGAFKTDYLDTNYRSGKQIVETASNIISYNSHQIPMVCKPSAARGEGAVRVVNAGVGQSAYLAAAAMVAEQVKAGVNDGDDYKDYGVGCRTNKEAYAFTTALLSGGIPFRSKYNPLTHWSTQALINWVVLANADANNKPLIDGLVVKCLAAPAFDINKKTLEDRLQQMAALPENQGKTYLQILEAGGWNQVYLDKSGSGRPTSRNQEKVKPYLDALLLARTFTGSPSEVIVRVLNEIKGADGISMADTLTKKESEREADDTSEDEIGDAANESPEEQQKRLKEAALAPLSPVIELAKNYGDLSSFLAYLRDLAKANDKVWYNDGETSVQEKVLNAVNVDTVHGWKGLEVKHMYVPMAAGMFPFFKGDPDSERRLAYVAITRGEDSVTVFDIQREDPQTKLPYSSRFIQEMACGKPMPEAPVSVEGAFKLATDALEEVAVLLAGEMTDGDDTAPLKTVPSYEDPDEDHPEDVLMTEVQEEAAEDETATLDDDGGPDEEVEEEIAASLALEKSRALMARLKR